MSRTLRPEDRIAHYRILRLLGAGGMGEVYMARDEKLERQVALKVLPRKLIRDDERLRRFILEAKSASSLNHPAIVTIYEIGSAPVVPGEGTAGASAEAQDPAEAQIPIHYLAMELIDGETLDAAVASRRVDLRGLLSCLAQVADGVAKAHAAGIVHRDLKPGNIMISRDGFAKVLDFGLAKLTERREAAPDLTSAPTAAGDRTGEGVIVGTAGYMSPEQVQGKPADPRSDIFSFGCILYEVTAGRKAFAGESNIDTMHQILHAMPAPVSDLSPEVPRELRRLIGRCLAKNPDQRAQSMKDLSLELREIVDEFVSLSTGGSSTGSGAGAAGSTQGPIARPVSGTAAAPAPAAGSRRTGLIAAAVVLGAAAIGAALWLAGRGEGGGSSAARQADAPGARTLQMSSLMGHPDLADSALSADGRYLAYVTAKSGRWGLRVRQVATGSDIEVVPPQDSELPGVVFSLDGNFLYYRARDLETPLYNSLFQVASLGGTPRRLFFDVDSDPTQSPDGRRVCFMRRASLEGTETLFIGDVATGQETALAAVKQPLRFTGAPAWSADGRRIAIVKASLGESVSFQVVAYEVEGGREEPVGPADWIYQYNDDLVWLRDGRGMVLSTWARGSKPNDYALWHLAYPSGELRRLTNDLSTYQSLSLSTDGTTLAVQRREVSSNLWSVPTDGSVPARQITTGTTLGESVFTLRATREGSPLFISGGGTGMTVQSASADGSGRRSVTSGDGFAFDFEPTPTGIVYNLAAREGGRTEIWSVGLDGSNPRRLTTGDVDQLRSVSPDGRQVIFTRASRVREVWQAFTDGGQERLFMANTSGCDIFSPDGRYVLCFRTFEAEGRTRSSWVIANAGDGSEVASHPIPPRTGFGRWMPDSRALSYVDLSDGRRTLVALPIQGGEPSAVLRIPEGRIIQFEWLPDGKQILLLIRTETDYSLQVAKLPSGSLTQLAQFPMGRVFEFTLDPAGRHAFFAFGDIRKEVVLLRDFL